MKRGIKSTILGVFFGAMFVLGILANVQAQEECLLATLQGEYLVTGEAVTQSGVTDPTFPRVAIAVWYFDGEGNISGFNRQSQGGQIGPRGSVNGTYTFDAADCTATLSFAAPADWDLFMTNDGSEGAALRIDPGTIATRSIKKR